MTVAPSSHGPRSQGGRKLRSPEAFCYPVAGILMPAERLQKIIAAAGVASRRKAEELISSGKVAVNGQTVTELGTKADPEKDHIRVNGKLLHGAQRHVYLLLNKPKGFVTTVSDPEGRPTVMSLIRGVGSRVYPVGRLDYASEGLLLMTNDGTLAHLAGEDPDRQGSRQSLVRDHPDRRTQPPDPSHV